MERINIKNYLLNDSDEDTLPSPQNNETDKKENKINKKDYKKDEKKDEKKDNKKNNDILKDDFIDDDFLDDDFEYIEDSSDLNNSTE